MDGPENMAARMPSAVDGAVASLLDDATAAAERTAERFFSRQHADGHWVAELEGDSILQSEWILLDAFLGRHDRSLCHKLATRLLEQQASHGGWAQYPGGEIDVSASVKAYFALKLLGHAPSSESMSRARAAILAAGGADRVNSFTRFYLAMLGQVSYDHCPDVPPEFVLLPRWFPINLYRVSAWSRTIIVPLSIVSAKRPVRHVAAEHGIRELFLKPPDEWPKLRCPGQADEETGWERFFRRVDSTYKWFARHGMLPLKRRAIRAAEKWMTERFVDSEGLGAIFPPMVWSRIALECLCYSDQSPEVRYCDEALDGLILEDEDTARIQPCKSPVWDTTIALRALGDAGKSVDDPRVERASRWLVEREVTRSGDWAKTVRAPAGGWCFEYDNAFYPDLDDTAMAVMALSEHLQAESAGDGALPEATNLVVQTAAENLESAYRKTDLIAKVTSATQRGVAWMLAMQNRDGGWGAFDKNNDAEFLCHVPFADHNAMIDPSTPDLTARVLEALGVQGHRRGQPIVAKAIEYLRDTQEADGSWYGRWGVNYIYGTWQVLVGLNAVGLRHDDEMMIAGSDWLLVHQQPCGAWGESPDSYRDPHRRGQGTPTASQTAWAVMGLIAAGRASDPATERGVRWLVDTQNGDGTWDEEEFTGTGFPLVFYLRYHDYRNYFPLMAISRWARAIQGKLP
ncbi:MAG: terpene cyclase/mutase family protein [Pirellulales bacterium]|nr:terpene cyclase/mutase family protein [Pirellulales bacterium]